MYHINTFWERIMFVFFENIFLMVNWKSKHRLNLFLQEQNRSIKSLFGAQGINFATKMKNFKYLPPWICLEHYFIYLFFWTRNWGQDVTFAFFKKEVGLSFIFAQSDIYQVYRARGWLLCGITEILALRKIKVKKKYNWVGKAGCCKGQ